MILGSRWRTGFSGAALVVAALLLGAGPQPLPDEKAGGATGDPAAQGQWSPPFDLHVIGVHSTLIHDGRVVLFSYPAERKHGSDSWTWDSANGRSQQIQSPPRRDLFCGGHSVLPDGRVFVTGGTIWGKHFFAGTPETSFFDPFEANWSSGPSMAFGRWYPSNLTLPNGDVLIVAGTDANEQPVTAVERFDLATGTVSRLPASADRAFTLYPRLHVLPSGEIFLAGQEAETARLDLQTAQWTATGTMNFGDRYAGTSVLLPGLQKVLALGGNRIDPEPPTLGTNPPTETAEIIDLSQPAPQWRYTNPMHFPRQHANAVLLPDGTVLVVGGGLSGLYSKPVKQTELFDPETETWTLLATQTAPREYHSTAILLPDGRVLSAGMDFGRWKRKGEVYSPPYLFKGPRPAITSAPSAVAYGATFTLATPDAAAVRKVVLLRPGSVTHSVNFEQRYVTLTFAAGDGQLRATAPAGGNVAPPGWYLLFLVNADGVPSVAAWLRVG